MRGSLRVTPRGVGWEVAPGDQGSPRQLFVCVCMFEDICASS